jgi:hypothetical protein
MVKYLGPSFLTMYLLSKKTPVPLKTHKQPLILGYDALKGAPAPQHIHMLITAIRPQPIKLVMLQMGKQPKKQTDQITNDLRKRLRGREKRRKFKS